MRYRNYCFGDTVFTLEECSKIKATFDGSEKKTGKLYGREEETIPDIINYHGSYIPQDDDTSWMYNRIFEKAKQLNGQSYQYDITGIEEQMYYNTYDSSLNHHFGWHVDSGHRTPYPRKLTVVVQLTDPDTYDGGTLEIRTPDQPIPVPKHLGSIVIFPSYRIHRVTPITRGVRNTVVAFVTGPELR